MPNVVTTFNDGLGTDQSWEAKLVHRFLTPNEGGGKIVCTGFGKDERKALDDLRRALKEHRAYLLKVDEELCNRMSI